MNDNKRELAASYARARRVSETGRRDDVVPICERILQLDPDSLDALQFLGMWHVDQGEFAPAALHLERLAGLDPEEQRVRLPLALALEESGHPREALVHARWVARSNHDYFLPYLYLGSIFERLGDERTAGWAYSAAAQLNPACNILDRDESVPAPARERARRGNALLARLGCEIHRLAAASAREDFPDADLGRVERAVWRRLHYAPAPRPDAGQDPLWLHIPDLDRCAWFEREEFEWVEALEAETGVIRDEVRCNYRLDEDTEPYLTHGEFDGEEWKDLVGTSNWGACHFYDGMKRNHDICARFPRAIAALERLPLFRVNGMAMEALYSVLRPRTRIPAHVGVTNAKLTVHLPLVVPEGCFLRAGGIERRVETGRCMFFDDTFEHEARNDSDEVRIVLIFQVWHPDLSEAERCVIDKSFTAYESWLASRDLDVVLKG